MSDKTLKHSIEVDANAAVAGVKKYTDAIKENEQAVKSGGVADVKASEESAAATEKAFTSKKQLKDMLKQLGHEFPLLGQVGRLALNPIAFTTAGIVGAFALWRAKLNEVKETYASLELPQNSPLDPAHVNGAFASWNAYLKTLRDIRAELTGVESQAAATLARINATAAGLKQIRELQKDENGQTPGGPAADAFFEKAQAEATYKAKMAEAAALEAEAKKKETAAASNRIPAKETDERNLADLKAQADAAMEDNKKRQAKLDQIRAATEQGSWSAKFAVLWRQYATGATTQGLADIENNAMDSNDAIIARYNKRMAESRARDESRAQRDKDYGTAASDKEKADKIRAEAVTEWLNAQVKYGITARGMGLPVPVTPGGVSGTVTPDASAEIARLQKLNATLLKSFNDFMTSWQNQLNSVAARQYTKPK